MRRFLSALQFVAIISAAVLVCSCGGKPGTHKAKMEIPSLGVSMDIPSGWTLDDPHMCHKGRCCTGILMDEPLDDSGFENMAASMSREYGCKILSKHKTSISGHQAIIVHLREPGGGNLLRAYVKRGDRIVWVSFMICKDEPYSRYEDRLMESVNSMKL